MPKSVISRNNNKFTAPANANVVTVQYPSDNVEVYEYRKDDILGAILKTITITYTANDKCDIESVVVS